MGTFPAGVIMHSFTGPAEAVKGLVKNGAYFSFSGFLTPIKPSKAKKLLEQVVFSDSLPLLQDTSIFKHRSLFFHTVQVIGGYNVWVLFIATEKISFASVQIFVKLWVEMELVPLELGD